MRKKKLDGIIEQIAARNGVSADEVLREMQIALDAAWNSPDPAARQKQRELFPNGKPSVEEFISVTKKQVKQ